MRQASMKTTIKTFLILGVFALSQIAAFAATEGWEITSFNSDITISPDGTVQITETIVADFANEEHQGIAREIPYEYNSLLSSYNAGIEFISTKDGNGNDWDNTVYESNGWLNIEMRNHAGVPDNEKHVYEIMYEADNVIGFFDTHDEFYWNVNGTDWPVATNKVTATVHLPQPIDKADLKVDCFTGAWRSSERDCQWTIHDSETITFAATRNFDAYENLSIVLGMPEGTIPPPSGKETFMDDFIKYSPLSIPFIVLIIMFNLWHKKGRDDQTVRDTVIPHYKPPKGLSPTETGTLIDEKLDPKDITATIIDYAVRGYIRINEIKKGHELELIKPYSTNKPFEALILNAIFDNNAAGEKKLISELKNKFYKEVSKIRKEIMSQLIKDNYFPHNPKTIRTIYIGVGVAIITISASIFPAISPLAAILGSISGAIVAIFGNFMPRKTTKGTETYYVLKGLYEYIDTAEKDRMKFQEDNNIMFEKLLPYAMSFGLIKKWSKAFDGIIKDPPSWYHPYHGWGHSPFKMTAFANDLNGIGNTLTKNISSRPGGKGGAWSGGSGFSGGFSGGGFGGGGGHGL
jgi:uncharacterized membrane protein YgcG